MSSLTDLLRPSSKASEALRRYLAETFPVPKLKFDGPVISPYVARSASLVGKAFDYLLRFEIQRAFPEITHARNWVAESALRYFSEKDSSVPLKSKQLNLPDDELIELLRKQQQRPVQQVHKKFEQCRTLHIKFIDGNSVSNDELIDCCLFLGQLDDVVRIGRYAIQFVDVGPPDPDNLADLKMLRSNLDVSLFAPRQHCVLNPSFGERRRLIGADGDLIVDETLIDIKTIKNAKIDRSCFNQVLCYYLLYLCSGVSNHGDLEITSIGIYFSRYNYLWRKSLNEIGSKKDFAQATRLLKDACRKFKVETSKTFQGKYGYEREEALNSWTNKIFMWHLIFPTGCRRFLQVGY